MKQMKHILLIALCVGAVACGGLTNKQTPTRGTATVLVDETLYPMVDGQVRVFHSRYPNATINVVTAPEQLIPAMMRADTMRIAILTRDLTADEQAWFDAKQIITRVTPIAYDAVALVVSRDSKDTTITEEALGDLLRGVAAAPAKGKTKGAAAVPAKVLVFDNPASGTVRLMKQFAEVDSLPSNVFSVNSHRELLEYVASNPNAIGFTGVDWLFEPAADQKQFMDKVRVVAVGDAQHGFFRPTQNDIAEGNYPFVRKVSIIDCQGFAGLGRGFGTFMASDVGQRIILKSGLVPLRYPKREIVIRSTLNRRKP